MIKKLNLKKNGNGKIKKFNFYKNKTDIIKSKMAYYLKLGLNLDEVIKLINPSKQILGEIRSDPEFESFVQGCQSSNKLRHIQAIEEASKFPQYWQASAWWLERRYSDEFGKRDLVKHEYNLKINTLTQVFLEIVNDVAPQVKHKIIQKLREYKFDGSNIANRSFTCLPSPDDENVIDCEEI